MKRGVDLRWDYAISGFASCLAVYSAGMGLVNVELGVFFVVLIAAGYLVSAFIQSRFGGSEVVKWSGILYAVAAVCAFQCVGRLNPLLPGEGFPDKVQVGAMCWMLAFCSFLAWTESAILFQAVPCIAIYGIVGAFDTFPGAPFAFFAFLISGAVLLSRARNRDLLRQAAESGYVHVDRINEGPWKGAAGPQWALTSAAVIVLISLIGAPVIQSSLSSVSGNVKIALPLSIIRSKTGSNSFNNQRVDETRVGSGAVHPGDAVLLAVGLDRPRYLRDDSFDLYGGHGWSKSPDAYLPGDRVWNEGYVVRRTTFAQRSIKNPQKIEFSVEVLHGTFEVLPSPGEPTRVVIPAGAIPSRPAISPSGDRRRIYRGESLVPDWRARPTAAMKDLPEPAASRFTQFGSTVRVRNLALSATRNRVTDYEKALAVQQAITSRVRYNLNAEAVPAGEDAVDYFLFESQEGYCDLFATSMVMMARAVGIPARYVTGYYPILDDRDSEGRALIHANEKHAWAELFFKDFGWVAFDATTGADEVEGYGRGSDGFGVAWYQRSAVKSAMDAAIFLAALAAFYYLWRGWRAGRAGRVAGTTTVVAASPVKTAIVKHYGGLMRDIERLSHSKKLPAETPQEYVARTAPALGETAAEVAAVTDRFVERIFSGRPAEPSEVAPFAESVRGARRSVRVLIPPLWKTAPLWAKERAKETVDLLKVLVRLRREDRSTS